MNITHVKYAEGPAVWREPAAGYPGADNNSCWRKPGSIWRVSKSIFLCESYWRMRFFSAFRKFLRKRFFSLKLGKFKIYCNERISYMTLACQAYMGLCAKLHMTFAGFRLQFVTKTYGSLRFGRLSTGWQRNVSFVWTQRSYSTQWWHILKSRHVAFPSIIYSTLILNFSVYIAYCTLQCTTWDSYRAYWFFRQVVEESMTVFQSLLRKLCLVSSYLRSLFQTGPRVDHTARQNDPTRECSTSPIG